MNNILTIDTASNRSTVALHRGSSLTERVSAESRQSAQRMLPMISELLLDAEIAMADIDLIGVVAGPGSFTGVRIGVAIAQGLSFSCEIPVVPLSSLALLAMAALSQDTVDRVLISEEARDNELYFAAYRRSSVQGVELIGREQVATIDGLDALPQETGGAPWSLVGDGWERQVEILQHLNCKSTASPFIPEISNDLLAQLTRLRFNCGGAVDAAQLRPNYVKEQLSYS